MNNNKNKHFGDMPQNCNIISWKTSLERSGSTNISSSSSLSSYIRTVPTYLNLLFYWYGNLWLVWLMLCYDLSEGKRYKVLVWVNKVDTTNRCEALKEVMSLNYVWYKYISKIQNISDSLKCFIYNISNILHIMSYQNIR